jgi:nucleoid DNA-binding protein
MKEEASSSTRVAVKTRDIIVPYVLKKNLVRPIMLGLKDALIEDGNISFMGFGKFSIVHNKRRSKKEQLTVKFTPSKSLVEEVSKKWNRPLEVSIVPPEDSTLEHAGSADGKVSEESSVREDPAEDTSLTSDTTS